MATLTPVLNRMYLFPIEVSGAISIDAAAISVDTAQASSKVRVGLYNNEGADGRPGGLIGQITPEFDTSTTGDKQSAGLNNPAGTSADFLVCSYPYVWVGVCAQAAAGTLKLVAHPNVQTRLPISTLGDALDGVPSMYYMSGVSGALPSTATLSGSIVSDIPLVLLRRDS